MTPFLSLNYTAYCLRTSVKHPRYFSLPFKSTITYRTNTGNIKALEFCSALAFAICTTIFFMHIGQIVLERSSPEMFRVYARRIVARMKNKKAFWNFLFVMKFPGKSMGMNPPSTTGFCKFSIPHTGSRCCPNPAFVRFFNVPKKSFRNFKCFSWVDTTWHKFSPFFPLYQNFGGVPCQ